MKIRKINSVYQVGIVTFLMSVYLASPALFAGVPMDDETLSNQTVTLAKLTPIVITAVQEDAAQSVESQNINHLQVAQKRADQAKEKNIYSTVLTEYELEKKDSDYPVVTNQHAAPTAKIKLMTVNESPYHRSDIRITTEDKITVYLGRDGNGN